MCDIAVASEFEIRCKFAEAFPVADIIYRVVTKYSTGIFYYFVEFQIIKIETGSKSVRSTFVEVVFRNRVYFVVNQG